LDIKGTDYIAQFWGFAKWVLDRDAWNMTKLGGEAADWRIPSFVPPLGIRSKTAGATPIYLLAEACLREGKSIYNSPPFLS
jgi:hypothetical protein